MLKNFLKIAWRNLIRNKAFSIINIAGLAIGMASAILILLWLQNEISYDRFHKNQARLYEVWLNDVRDGAVQSGVPTPQLMGPALKNDFPEIENTTRVSWNNSVLFSYGNQSLKADGIWVDPAFLTMFSFPFLSGDPKTALDDPHALVITKALAKKAFGSQDPIGKVIKLDNREDFKISGVLKDLPNNTQFHFEYLQSAKYLESKNFMDADWTDISIRTFALLKPGVHPDEVNSKIKNLVAKYSGGRAKDEAFLYPLTRLRLYDRFENGKPAGGRIEMVRIFGIIAVFILLIACINFMNLSTARSEKRAKEVGIRKVSGALMKSLVFQFLIESTLISAISGLLAFVTVMLLLPAFNELTGKQLHIDLADPVFWALALGFIGITGLLAGSYPAFSLSMFKPVAVLKGHFKKVQDAVTPRKILVITQFSFAIILVICTIIIVQQIRYAADRQTGYDKNNLAYVYMEGDIQKNYALIRNELMASGAAQSVNQTLAPLTQTWSAGSSMTWEGKDPQARISFDRSMTDGRLAETAGLQFITGRDIDLDRYPTDSTACVINEAAARVLKFKNPIGQTITDDPDKWHIVGVIKDFILLSPYEQIRPIIFKGPKYSGFVMNIKWNGKQTTPQNLASAEKIFKKFNPSYPFEYHFVDEEYAKKFSDQQLTAKLVALFAGLTIFISCLGLFGLAAYLAQNRIKEIGVRKILGASVTQIATLLSKDFLKLILISIGIASPVAWYFMHRWLLGFEYHVQMNAYIFIASGLFAIGIALVTVSFQAIKAAMRNPVTSLRSE